MSQSIGELFVDLGIKGSEKTVGAIGSVKTGLSETKSMALETKAGILAVVYGFEQLMSASTKLGTSLLNFETLTGVSTDTLQRYQYVARQVGGTNEEMAASFKSIQDKMTLWDQGKLDAHGLSYMANKLGHGFDVKQRHDSAYMLKYFQDFAKLKDVPIGMKNWALDTMGLGEHVKVAAMRGMFTDANLAKAPKYSHGEAERLDKARAAIANLENKVEMAIGHFTAEHGLQMVKDLSNLTDQFIKLAEAITKVSDKFKLFDRFGSVIAGIANSLKLTVEIIDRLEGKGSKKGDLLYRKPGEKLFPEKTWGDQTGGFHSDTWDAIKENFLGGKKSLPKIPAYAPKTPVLPSGKSQPHAQIEINQHFQHPGENHGQVADASKKGIQAAYRASFAQSQVS